MTPQYVVKPFCAKDLEVAETVVRKRSPRSPSIPLADVLERVLKVYAAVDLQPASADVIAHHLGYKSAINGAARAVIASGRYYGLLDRPGDGMLAVNARIAEYQDNPASAARSSLLKQWLRSPDVFAELLDKYPASMPSLAMIRSDLAQRGFTPNAAEECLNAFIQSVAFADYYQQTGNQTRVLETQSQQLRGHPVEKTSVAGEPAAQKVVVAGAGQGSGGMAPAGQEDDGNDRIPVRLAGGRRAWLVIPSPFYQADKKRLLSQVELLLTDDEA